MAAFVFQIYFNLHSKLTGNNTFIVAVYMLLTRRIVIMAPEVSLPARLGDDLCNRCFSTKQDIFSSVKSSCLRCVAHKNLQF